MDENIVAGSSWRVSGQPGSAGRTIIPCSSIQTTLGMLTTPRRVSTWWPGSRSDGCSGLAASM
jgi:hypothetical protein